MKNYEEIIAALHEVGIPYINLISKDLSDDTFRGEYVDPKNPDKCFTFDGVRIVSSNNIHSLIDSTSISINKEDELL